MLYVAETQSQFSRLNSAVSQNSQAFFFWSTVLLGASWSARLLPAPNLRLTPRKWKRGLAARSTPPGARVPRDLEFREVAANPGLSELLGSGILALQEQPCSVLGCRDLAKTTRTSSGRQLLGSNPSRIKRDFFFFPFPLEIGFGVSPALSPPPRNSSPLFFFLLLLLLPETWPGQWLLEEEQVWEKGEEIGAK